MSTFNILVWFWSQGSAGGALTWCAGAGRQRACCTCTQDVLYMLYLLVLHPLSTCCLNVLYSLYLLASSIYLLCLPCHSCLHRLCCIFLCLSHHRLLILFGFVFLQLLDPGGYGDGPHTATTQDRNHNVLATLQFHKEHAGLSQEPSMMHARIIPCLDTLAITSSSAICHTAL